MKVELSFEKENKVIQPKKTINGILNFIIIA